MGKHLYWVLILYYIVNH